MREFFNKPAGKIVVVVLLVVGIGALAYSLFSGSTNSVVANASDQVFIDAKTGQTFSHELIRGEVSPILAPSGGKTGYIPEQCFWTPDGHPKDKPDYVLLKSALNQPGPTFCPFCHRLVIEHNPPAVQGAKPPPTEDEYNARHAGS